MPQIGGFVRRKTILFIQPHKQKRSCNQKHRAWPQRRPRGCLSILGNIIPSGGSQNKFVSKTFGIKEAADVPHSRLWSFQHSRWNSLDRPQGLRRRLKRQKSDSKLGERVWYYHIRLQTLVPLALDSQKHRCLFITSTRGSIILRLQDSVLTGDPARGGPCSRPRRLMQECCPCDRLQTI